jgi:hypothetical protein
MKRTTTLETSNIREVWDRIKPGLEEIKAQWPALSTWRVEDVYAAVIMEQAVLYATDDGFAVCTLDIDQYSGEKDLCIWIAYAYNKGQGTLNKYLPSFIEVARDLGCRGVSTLSNHPALSALFDEEHRVYTKYRVDIDGEKT